LVLNVFIMAVFAMLAIIVYKSAKSMVGEAVYYERSSQAMTIAEAGMEDALFQLYSTSSWRTGFSSKSFAGGYYTVTLATGPSSVTVVSTGYSPSILWLSRAVKTVSVNAVFVSSSVPEQAVIANDLTVNGTVDSYDPRVSTAPTTFAGGATIWSNAGIDTSGVGDGPPRLFGDASYFSSPAPLAADVTGSITQSTYTISLPQTACGACTTVNNDAFGVRPSSAINAGTHLTVSGVVTISSGTYYFSKVDLNAGGILNIDTTIGPVTIFYDHQWNETAGCAVNNLSGTPSRLVISDMGTNNTNTIALNCSTPLYAYLDGNTKDRFVLSQTLYGRVIGGTVTVNAGAKLHYDVSGGVPAAHLAWSTGPSGSWTESYKRQ